MIGCWTNWRFSRMYFFFNVFRVPACVFLAPMLWDHCVCWNRSVMFLSVLRYIKASVLPTSLFCFVVLDKHHHNDSCQHYCERPNRCIFISVGGFFNVHLTSVLLDCGKIVIRRNDVNGVCLFFSALRRRCAEDAIKVNHYFHFASLFLISFLMVPRTASTAWEFLLNKESRWSEIEGGDAGGGGVYHLWPDSLWCDLSTLNFLQFLCRSHELAAALSEHKALFVRAHKAINMTLTGCSEPGRK